jgi:hypothetical protein
MDYRLGGEPASPSIRFVFTSFFYLLVVLLVEVVFVLVPVLADAGELNEDYRPLRTLRTIAATILP